MRRRLRTWRKITARAPPLTEQARPSLRRPTGDSSISECFCLAHRPFRTCRGRQARSVLRGFFRVGLDHSVADEPGQRAIIEGAQTKEGRLALRASLLTHHLVTAPPKNDDGSR